MKNALALSIVLALMFPLARAQDASALVSAGRTHLAQGNLTNANASFAAAVATNPNDQTAHAFYAMTRLLVLPNDPEIGAFLDRLGISPTNRNAYNWKTRAPSDTNGVPLAPTGVSAHEGVELARLRVLREIEAATTNLAKITNPGFTLTLRSNETALGVLTLDYGDALMLRALAHLAAYVGYTLTSWNYDVQLTALRAMLTNETFSLERVLADNPALLAFSTTNDLERGRRAFQQVAELYPLASQFIRSRSTNVTRLFNYDPEMEMQEQAFRQTLAEVNASLNGPVVLTLDTNLVAHLGRQFANPIPARALLPRFYGNAAIAGTLPDATLGGLVQGVPAPELERMLADAGLSFVSRLQIPERRPDGSLRIAVHGLNDSFFIVQQSADLRSWADLTYGTAVAGMLSFSDAGFGQGRRFYRAVDRSDAVRVRGTVLDVSTERPVAGAGVTLTFVESVQSAATAGTDENGNFFLYALPGREAGRFALRSTATGLPQAVFYIDYWPDHTAFELPIFVAPDSYRPPNDNFANRIVLTGTNVAAAGYTLNATSEMGEPMHGGVSAGRSIWWAWTAPASGAVEIASALSSGGHALAIYTGSSLAALTPYWSVNEGELSLAVMAGTTYVLALDSWSPGGKAVLSMRTAPPVFPEFLEEPKSQNVSAGSYFYLQANAAGTAPLRYQWRKNGSDLPGATNQFLMVQSAKLVDAGMYSVRVENVAGAIESAGALVGVQ